MRKHLESVVQIWEHYGGSNRIVAALRTLETLAQFYRERDRADEYLEMLRKIRLCRERMGYASDYGPFCRYEVI